MQDKKTKDALAACTTLLRTGGTAVMKQNEIQKLADQAKRHEYDAFTQLMQYCMKDMYKTALAILMNDEDAADAIQDTILACWEKLHTLKKTQYFKTWLTRILINKCYDIRRKRARLTSFEDYDEPAYEGGCNFELKEALAALDEKYRLVILLFYGEGYSVCEIAKLLKIPKSTVTTRLQRGRERLARYYETSMNGREGLR